MPETVKSKTETKPRRKLSKSLRVGSALVLSTATAMAAHPNRANAASTPAKPKIAKIHSEQFKLAKQQRIIDKLADQIARQVRQEWPSVPVTKETVEGKGLQPVKSLPGFEHQVTPEQQEQLAASSVHLVYRTAGSNEKWSGWCSGTKITYKGQTYVLSAGHCFKSGLNGNQDNSEGEPSYDYINTSTREYGIVKKEGEQPYVLVTGISMDVDDDWALLSTDVAPTAAGMKAYENIPALDFNKPASLPQIGEQGIAYGYAQFNNFQPLAKKVRFLGRYRLYGADKDYHYYDLVGINQGQVQKSVCLPGDSGSGAEFSNGFVTGPLSEVYDFGYKYPAQNNLSPFGVNPLDRYAFEQITKINLAGMEGVCKFPARDVNNFGIKINTMQILVDGFSRPVPVYGKGGDTEGQG